MNKSNNKLITTEKLFDMIKPGSRLYLSSGSVTPVKTIREILESDHYNLIDLEFIQIATLVDIFSMTDQIKSKGRLKTFTVGETISRSFNKGNVDFVPTTMAELPYLFVSGAIGIDFAIIQTTMPDSKGMVNLGPVNDISSLVIEKSTITIAEMNPNVPNTGKSTNISLDSFDYVLESDEPILTFEVSSYDSIMRKIGKHVSDLVEDGSTVSMGAGRIFNAIGDSLVKRRDLLIRAHVISDWIIKLSQEGALAKGGIFGMQKGIIASSCVGSQEVYDFIDKNPDVIIRSLLSSQFQKSMPSIQKLVSILNVKKIDISGDAVQISRKELQVAAFDGKLNFSLAATQSRDGKSIVVLKSIDYNGESNIVISLLVNQELIRSTLGTTRYVVTEYGIANLFGKSIRERCLALIEIAHPQHRENLIKEAREKGILYEDQIYRIENALKYPSKYETVRLFKNDFEVNFRPIKASDEDMMRRLFYEFSDESKYLRYFSRIRSMPHEKMQSYVNIDYTQVMSIVGVIFNRGVERIIAEGRYAYYEKENVYELAFVVDEEFHGMGIGSSMLDDMFDIAKDRGIKKLVAYVLYENASMLHIFKHARITPFIKTDGNEVELTYDMDEDYQIILNF